MACGDVIEQDGRDELSCPREDLDVAQRLATHAGRHRHRHEDRPEGLLDDRAGVEPHEPQLLALAQVGDRTEPDVPALDADVPDLRAAGIADISVQGNHVRFGPVELPESAQLRLQRLYPKSLVKDAVRTILVPKPMTARVGGQPLRDTAVLRWASDLIHAVLLDNVAEAARVATARS